MRGLDKDATSNLSMFKLIHNCAWIMVRLDRDINWNYYREGCQKDKNINIIVILLRRKKDTCLDRDFQIF